MTNSSSSHSSLPRTRTRIFGFSLLAVALFQLKPDTVKISNLLRTPTSSIEKESNETVDTGPVFEIRRTPAELKQRKKQLQKEQRKEQKRNETTFNKTLYDDDMNATLVIQTQQGNETLALVVPTEEQKQSSNTTIVTTQEREHDTFKTTDVHHTYKSSSSHSFNYTAFWQDAMEAAFASLEAEEAAQSAPPAPCPKVYVYQNLPSKLRDSPKTLTTSYSFGRRNNKDAKYKGYLYNTNQYALSTILENRLLNSKQCRTKDPNEADLFYATVLTKPKMAKPISKACHGINGKMVRDALVHLNETNACRHFFVLGKGHYNAKSCDGWYHNPIPELQHAQRLAYSHFSFHKSKKRVHSYSHHDKTKKEYPNLMSAPYPSLYTLRQRRTLANYHSLPRHPREEHSWAILEVVITVILKYAKRLCNHVDDITTNAFVPATRIGDRLSSLQSPNRPFAWSLQEILLGENHYRFHYVWMHSSLFFQLTDDVAPWFWQDWKARARVVVPRDEFVAGRIDLKVLLESIPPKLLKLMQSTLKAKARRFQYSVDDDQEDGIRVILDNLHREALEMESQGKCGYH
jgi:hypothetical protein